MVETLFIDADGLVLGRMISFVAKQALLGKEVNILNCEKAIISGNVTSTVARLKLKRSINSMKPEKGPFYSVDPEKMVKRTVRGMLPDWRNGRGKEALRRVKCYKGIPVEFKKEKITDLKINRPQKAITVQELSDKA